MRFEVRLAVVVSLRPKGAAFGQAGSTSTSTSLSTTGSTLFCPPASYTLCPIGVIWISLIFAMCRNSLRAASLKNAHSSTCRSLNKSHVHVDAQFFVAELFSAGMSRKVSIQPLL